MQTNQDDTYDPRVSELLTVKQASDMTKMSREHLALLMRTGKLWGVKLGRDWYTIQEALDAYLAQNNRPGPKRKNPLLST